MIQYEAVDLFCGGGGTSSGLLDAASELGMTLNLTAINHWNIAIETHLLNHPNAKHLCESLDNVNPRHVVKSGALRILIASPECTHHSGARGGKPCSDQSRASAFHILRWAEALRIEDILIENVPEFKTWGPLGRNGRPIKSRRGQTFEAFLNTLVSLDYTVEHRVLNCANYGDATTRERLFVIARRNGRRINWPTITHTEKGDNGKQRWRHAREIIDWQHAGKSIFGRKKPLAPNTLARIAAGLKKFGWLDAFIIDAAYGVGPNDRDPHRRRAHSLDKPLGTITGVKTKALIQPFLVKFHGGPGGVNRVHSVDKPLATIDTSNRFALCEPFLVKFYRTGTAVSVDKPLDTITTHDRFGVVTNERGEEGEIDILFRMLQPHELAAATSFHDGYRFAGNKDDQVKQIGNAVPRRTAMALCRELLS